MFELVRAWRTRSEAASFAHPKRTPVRTQNAPGPHPAHNSYSKNALWEVQESRELRGNGPNPYM